MIHKIDFVKQFILLNDVMRSTLIIILLSSILA
jgi:hypothetical protein